MIEDKMISRGPIEESPMFFIRALRQIIYRLQKQMLWSSNNDIRFYVPKQHLVEFITAWVRVFPPVNPIRQIIENREIEIDGIKIQIREAPKASLNLGVFRVDDIELIKWDERSARMQFIVPWAMAEFLIGDNETAFIVPGGPKNNYEYLP